MSTIIRLDIVLREAVSTPYRDLVTRPTGAAVRHRVLTVLRDTGDDDAELDFSEVGLVDFSCADEVVAKLLVATLDQGVPRLVLRGVQEHHADAIEQALSRYDLLVVAILVNAVQPRLLGAAPDDWRTAFGALDRIGRAPISPVADALDWPVSRAADALRGLTQHRCVVSYPDETFAIGAVA
jgi:hypothetical protein